MKHISMAQQTKLLNQANNAKLDIIIELLRRANISGRDDENNTHLHK